MEKRETQILEIIIIIMVFLCKTERVLRLRLLWGTLLPIPMSLPVKKNNAVRWKRCALRPVSTLVIVTAGVNLIRTIASGYLLSNFSSRGRGVIGNVNVTLLQPPKDETPQLDIYQQLSAFESSLANVLGHQEESIL